jgi:hypothetical protein
MTSRILIYKKADEQDGSKEYAGHTSSVPNHSSTVGAPDSHCLGSTNSETIVARSLLILIDSQFVNADFECSFTKSIQKAGRKIGRTSTRINVYELFFYFT